MGEEAREQYKKTGVVFFFFISGVAFSIPIVYRRRFPFDKSNFVPSLSAHAYYHIPLHTFALYLYHFYVGFFLPFPPAVAINGRNLYRVSDVSFSARGKGPSTASDPSIRSSRSLVKGPRSLAPL